MGFFIWPLSNTKPVEMRNSEKEIERILRNADRNSDGVLNKKELEEAFRNLGARFPGWRASAGLRAADRNNDGMISEDELDELIKYANSKYGYK